jgi:hypothetical protein
VAGSGDHYYEAEAYYRAYFYPKSMGKSLIKLKMNVHSLEQLIRNKLHHVDAEPNEY